MKMFDDYFKLQNVIHEYFGYVEDWKVIPLNDLREMYWAKREDGVVYHSNREYIEDGSKGEFYYDAIYTQRFLPKYVYETGEYTMISCDTRTDDNKFLSIFDNKRRLDLTDEQWNTYRGWL